MKEENFKNIENLLSKLDSDRSWILKNIDIGKWSELRIELATIERFIIITIIFYVLKNIIVIMINLRKESHQLLELVEHYSN